MSRSARGRDMGAKRREIRSASAGSDTVLRRSWLPPLLALVIILPIGFGAANTFLLSACASFLYLAFAAVCFAFNPIERSALVRAAPVLILAVLFLAWTAFPALGLSSRRASPRIFTPDVLGVAWCHALAVCALFLASATVGLRHSGSRSSVAWICVLAGALMAMTLAARGFGFVADPMTASQNDSQHRFSGTIGNPNAAGVTYGMFSLLLAGVAIDQWKEWRGTQKDVQLFAALSAVVGALVAWSLVGLTQSRAAFVYLLLAQTALIGFGVIATSRAWNWRRCLSLAALLCFAGSCLLLSATSVIERFGVFNEDGIDRLVILRHYAKVAAGAPLSGFGLGSFVAVNQHLLTPSTALSLATFGAAHNAALQLVIEAGWPGLLLTVLAMVAVSARIARAWPRRSGVIFGSMLLAVALASAASMTDIALNVPAITGLAAALLGLCWGQSLRLVSATTRGI